MVTKCLVCKGRAVTGSGISFHQLPKDKDLRNAWVKACHLDDLYINQVNASYKICSKHFMENDFRITRIGGSKILKPKAIPFVVMLKMHKNEDINLNLLSSDLQTFEYDNSKNTETYVPPTDDEDMTYHNETNVERMENVRTKNQSTETRADTTNTQESQMECLPQEIENQIIPEFNISAHRLTTLLSDNGSEISKSRNEPDSQTTPQKSKGSKYIWQPSRISDCTSQHFSTPRRNLDLAKSELRKKQRRIKTLLQKNCRLIKKVKTYENLITHLRSKSLLSENVENILQMIPETKDPICICDSCLEQVSYFYTIKKTSLQNSCQIKHFKATLNGINKLDFNELNIKINLNEVSAQHHHSEFKVHANYKNLLSSEHEGPTHIKEEVQEYDVYSQQLENDESNLSYLQDDESSSNSDDNTQHHMNVGSYEFVDVNKSTETDSILKFENSRHKDQPKTYENEKNIFKCTDCHKVFTCRSNLNRHTQVHTGEKPFECTTCQKTFTRHFTLKTHKLTHTSEKPHECDVCLKIFNRKSNLLTHKRIHNNVRPHKCAVCNKRFVQFSHLNTHMLTHTGEKSHQCHLCEYKCTQAGHLKIHIRSHTGEKPYSCKHCEKSFKTTSHLKEHERKLHSNENSK